MQVAVLAGGLGTRLRSVAGNLPKALVPVAGRPFIEWQLDLLAAGGFSEAVYCLGYGSEMISSYFEKNPRTDIKVSFSLEDHKHLLGTGGAIINALPALEDQFFVIYGDSYLPEDYLPIIEKFERSSDRALMCVFRNDDQWDKSNVRIGGGKVVFYDKKALPGDADCIDYGLSAFRKEVFLRYVHQPMPLDLATVLHDLVEEGKLAAHEVQERFYEIGKPEGIKDLEEFLTRRNG